MVAHFMYRAFRDSATFSSERVTVPGRTEAARHAKVLALAGNIEITVELVDDDGEVVSYCEKGVWRDA
jgi:hypothetical protein